MIAPWGKTTTPKILSNQKLENIFNADKFDYYQCLLNKAYHYQKGRALS